MPRISGPKLIGRSGRVRQGNRASIDFSNFGIPAAPAANFSMTGRNIGRFVDAEEPDSIEITQQPAVGEAAVRPDGTITLDLREYDPAGEVAFQYRKTKGGVITLVDAAVDVANARKKGGWGSGVYYRPRADSQNRLIARPRRNTKRIFIDEENGDGYGSIVSKEPGVSSTGQVLNWILNNESSIPVSDGDGGQIYVKYGEHRDKPIKLDLALSLYGYYFKPEENEHAPHLMFAGGQDYNADVASPNSKWIWLRAHSASHPMLISAWGSGKPNFTNIPFIGRVARNIIWQDATIEEVVPWDAGASNMILDGIRGNGIADTIKLESSPTARQITMRRLHITDGYEHAPREGGNNGPNGWDTDRKDRTGTSYFSAVDGLLLEDIYMDTAGYAEGYRADFTYFDPDSGLYFPQTPTVFSHLIYAQGNYKNAMFRNMVLSRSSMSGAQFRAGGIVLGLLVIEANSGFSIGNGEYVRNPSDDLGMPNYPGQSSGFALGNANTWSLVYDAVVMKGGFHQHWRDAFYDTQGNLIPAGPNRDQHLCYGISLQDLYVGLRHVLVIDHDPNRPGLVDLTGPETIGPCVEYIPGYGSNTRAFSQTTAILDQVDNNQQPDPEQYDVQFCNWDAATPDYRVDGISQLIKDGTTLEAYEDQKTGSSGKTHYDFHNRMRASEAPWEERREISDWFRGRMGNNVTRRTTPKTMQFRPNAWKYTPGFMACIELDWSADGLEGLPGDVEGDSVDTYGAPYMNWNLDPKFDFEGLTLRRILMEVTQGALIASDPVTVIGDSRVNPSMGTIFGIGGYNGSDKLAVDCYDGMFMNTGDVQGNVDITARANSDVALVMDDGDFTLSSGNSLTIYGMSNVGFDGVSATTRTLTIEPGSTVSFKPTLRIWCQENGASYFLPKPGHEMTGSGGTIGTVREFQPRIEDDFMAVLDDIQYVPANAENVSGVVIRGLDDDQGEKTDYARLDYNEHAPEVWFDGSISEVVTGIKGFDDFKTDKVIEPDSPSAVVINGGTLHLDVTGVANGTYTLVNVDSVSGAFDAVTAAGNGAKELTIAITASAVTLLVEDGDGTVTGGTS
ncbi:hypothetical protein GI582_18220 [Sulfitobacter sp. BDSS02]|nr:hypothetical protein [Sulfitobacter sp. BDSS02]MBR9852066.1 hypothetical protein [Paracoccaceae bacterium]